MTRTWPAALVWSLVVLVGVPAGTTPTAPAWPTVSSSGPYAPQPPTDASAAAVFAWWSALTDVERDALVARPDVIGALDGIPATARDLANRRQLATDVARLHERADGGSPDDIDGRVLINADRVVSYLDEAGDLRDAVTGEAVDVQLYIYEPAAFDGDGRVGISTGNLDTAAHVGVVVPGFLAKVENMVPIRSRAVYEEARLWTDDTVAVLDWAAYDTPSFGDTADVIDVGAVINREAARAGAELLASDVDGLRAIRPADRAHLTVLGNSYGATTAAYAAADDALSADDLVLSGSPGAGGAETAADLTTGAQHTWVGSASHDFVAQLGTTGWIDPSGVAAALIPGVELLGRDPSEDRFGAQRFTAENIDRDGGNFDVGWDDVFAGRWREAVNATTINNVSIEDHGHYYDPGTESLYNVGAIVTGHLSAVAHAEPRHDPGIAIDWDWLHTDVSAGVVDPELDREPTVHLADGTRP